MHSPEPIRLAPPVRTIGQDVRDVLCVLASWARTSGVLADVDANTFYPPFVNTGVQGIDPFHCVLLVPAEFPHAATHFLNGPRLHSFGAGLNELRHILTKFSIRQPPLPE